MKKEVTLADVTIDGKGHYGLGASAVPFSEELYTYLRITDIKDDGTINLDGLMSVDNERAEEYLLHPNDIVFARTGASTGRNYFFDVQDGEFVYAGFLIKFSIDPAKINPKFVKYYCQSEQYKGWVSSFNTGSTRGNINAKTYAQMPIPLIDKNKQDFLVNILTSLDEKIRLNREINQNLSELLQAYYQEHFNLQHPGLINGCLSDICNYSKTRIAVTELTTKSYYSTENMLPNKAGAANATNIPSVVQTTKCAKGNTLVSNIRPYFKKIVYCYEESGCSNDVLCFSPNSKDLSVYLYCTLFEDYFFDYMVAGSKGTKMPRGDKQQIMSYPIIIPNEGELNMFNEIAYPIMDYIHSLNRENEKLISIRDILLPRLLSGELDVSAIDI